MYCKRAGFSIIFAIFRNWHDLDGWTIWKVHQKSLDGDNRIFNVSYISCLAKLVFVSCIPILLVLKAHTWSTTDQRNYVTHFQKNSWTLKYLSICKITFQGQRPLEDKDSSNWKVTLADMPDYSFWIIGYNFQRIVSYAWTNIKQLLSKRCVTVFISTFFLLFRAFHFFQIIQF